ncbi:MAG TPA: hypothetical protein VKI00_33580 [Mycobacterium sp.]|uniref:hypothetical protein n=1 Tax=Mycobacterium sp. TaxID=1785 RepID=UPI002CB8EA91|nr:hypothetical protein [Mycobacterium sp.]HME80425.1 hypothetical protein [Mycobacterium sp.]
MANDDDGSPNDRDDRTGGDNGLPPGIAKKDWIPPGIAKQIHENERHVTAPSHTTVNLGNSNATVTLQGNNITVLGQDGDVTVTGGHTSFDHINLGNGTDIVTFGPQSSHNVVSVGSGHDTISTVAGDNNNTFRLNGSTASLVLHGTSNTVFINGGTDSITDSPFVSDALRLRVGTSGGTINISNFAASSGVVDLASNLGFSSGAAAAAAVTTDNHGGSLLTFAGGLGSIDFYAVPVGLLHASNFEIT